MVEHFNPGVMVDGVHVEPEGWMWVLAFALGGVDWAVRDARDPAFDLRGKIDDYYRRRSIYFAEREVQELERRLEIEQARLDKLRSAVSAEGKQT